MAFIPGTTRVGSQSKASKHNLGDGAKREFLKNQCEIESFPPKSYLFTIAIIDNWGKQLEEKIPPQSRVAPSHLDTHDEEALVQAPGGVELTDAFHRGSIRSQATMGSVRGKRAGPAIQSQADSLRPSASLTPQAPQERQNKEWELQDDPKGMLTPLSRLHQPTDIK